MAAHDDPHGRNIKFNELNIKRKSPTAIWGSSIHTVAPVYMRIITCLCIMYLRELEKKTRKKKKE